jgi:hypothetical protein
VLLHCDIYTGELTDAELCAKNEAFRMNVKSQCYSLECEIKDLKAKHQADLSKAAVRSIV